MRTQFIDPSTKIVEDPASDIENEILATYLPNKANEPEAATPLALPPPVTPQAALTHIEGLLLLPLQAEPTANIRDLQDILQREKKRIETLEIQRRITDFLVPPGGASTLTFPSPDLLSFGYFLCVCSASVH